MRALASALMMMLAVDAGRLLVPTNSRRSVQKGIEAYGKGDYGAAERAFRDAAKLRPSATTAFDLGTAQIAAGNHAEGSAVLSQASEDPALRADALYNRGSGALASRAYDHAVRDFEDVLRIRPADVAAKRNLEIALRRRQEQEKRQGQQRQEPQQQPESKQERPEQGSGDREGAQRESDAEALLRSVEQQEREELSRMRRARKPEPRIGW